ncbi:uncharacterized protein [Miscanthus floridulus]|uniref:uncharacterized protein n=1 Tax=Miscanthus floridulus TaxID=154761 RepID=UPI003457D99F
MPRRGKSSKPSFNRTVVGTTFTRLPLPIGVPVPMCYCGDRCRVAISDEEKTYKQRYWMCDNWQSGHTPRQIRIGLLDPPPLCDFDEWIGTEIKEKYKEHLRKMKEWEVERKELFEKRRKDEPAEKEHKEEAERRYAAQRMEERKKKLERVRRAKSAVEKNPDALRKGK